MRKVMFTALLTVFLGAVLARGEKLKGIYSGSGGMSEDVHRVVMIEFGEDGTALIQQNWTGKEPQVWHGRWTKDGKQVTISFDAEKNQPTPKPLLLQMKRSVLTPTSWDATLLGVLGPPKLSPFGGKNIKQHSVSTCQGINTRDPSQNCVTWSSRN